MRNFVSYIAALAFTCLALNLSAAASVLCYKSGPQPGSADIHTIIYTDNIGYIPVKGGSIDIDGRSITIYGRPDEVSERVVLLTGQLVKTKMYSDKTGRHFKGIAYFTNSKLLQDQLRTRQHDIVFIEDGFVSGKIESFTPSSVLINDHGMQRSIQLSAVRGIRSPCAYNLQMDLLPYDEYGKTDSTAATNSETAAGSTAAKNLSANNKPVEAVERQYNAVNCSLRETMPPRTIASESIAPRHTDDDLDDLTDDLDGGLPNNWSLRPTLPAAGFPLRNSPATGNTMGGVGQ